MILITLGVIGFSTSTALAGQPVKSEDTRTEKFIINDVCSFKVDVVSTITAREKLFFDHDGVLTRISYHYNYQDQFSANGKSIQGIPYNANMEIIFDESGEITHVYANGVIAKMRLPDGSLFISAGRLDFIKYGYSYVLSPDKGNPGNIDGFCEALAP